MDKPFSITIEQPGAEVEGTITALILQNMSKPESIAVLWSPWGIEGVFTSTSLLTEAIRSLRSLIAYRDERLTVEIRDINPTI